MLRETWKKLFAKGEGPPKMRPIHAFIIIMGVGVAFMVLTDFLAVKPDGPPEGGTASWSADSAAGLMSGGDPPGETDSAPAVGGSFANDVIREYENMYETQLEEILQTVVGVDKVEVMVNLDSTPEIVVEKNRDARSQTTRETDRNSGTREIAEQSHKDDVVVVQGSKQDHPVVLKTLKPRVRGVLVVAKGAENIQVKVWITEAVQRVLDVPAYKISILPKKG